VADRTIYIRRPVPAESQCPTFGRGKNAISHSDYNPIYVMMTLLYRTLQLMLSHDRLTVIQCTCMIGCRQQLCIQNCGQTAADRNMVTILTVYNKLVIAPSNGAIADPIQRTVSSLHALQTTDDDMQHIVPKTGLNSRSKILGT